ncbi:MAG: MFS transporter [Methylobacteriaceae bacterium]|nr:MFS transporter [Methylobacteriaceae bacterium]
MPNSASAAHAPRRLPVELIIAAGCAIAILSFGPRSAIGAFQRDVLVDNNWTRDVFSIAIALQNLMWGLGQPLAGGFADRFGAPRVLIVGALLYTAGLVIMGLSTTPVVFGLSAGVLIGLGLSGASFNLVLGAFGRLVPENRRSMAFGFGTAAGSLGQFLFAPLAVALIQNFDWRNTSFIFAAMMMAIVPLSFFLAYPREPASAKAADAGPAPTIGEAIRQAFMHKSYVLLVTGYFTCGFQLAFITTHFQIYLTDKGLDPRVGGWAFAMIGIFNMVGSLASGWFGTRMPRRYILAFIYFSRAMTTLVFLLVPATPVSAIIFGAVTGLLWLSTVPPTSSLVGVMFGQRNFAMLYGFTFVSHQIGGFLGALLGGTIYEATGSYNWVWMLSIFFGVASALINLPIEEKPAEPKVVAA